MKSENKVAIITGASGGIGSELTKKLALLKFDLAILGRKEEKLAELKKQAEGYGVNVKTYVGDLFDDNFVDTIIDKIYSDFGKIDVLINNAGITLNCKVEDTSLEDYDKIMKLNARVPFCLCKNVLKYLRSSDFATIINIASIVGHTGYVNQGAYSASKHALIGFSQSLSKEVYKENIRVHLITPGGVYTDMVKISRPDLTPDGMIMPTDIADIVEFILTHRTNAVIDEFVLHRLGKEPF